jgi:threonine dehydrogenase-like Zn-dependent dehydrogenase
MAAAGETMAALVYAFSPGRWWLARHAGRTPALAVAWSGVRLQRLPVPQPPGPDWVRLRVRLAGICGTDVGTLRGHTGPQLSPFVSFPAVLGHEILAVVEEGPWAGRRVVVDPFLGCLVRGLPLCPACRRGQTALCHRFAEGDLPPGMLLGYCRGLPGGWGERLVAHRSQLHPVPDGVADAAAALAEPLAVAAHAVLPHLPEAGSRVLVIGAGTVGLSVVAALALLGSGAEVVVVARRAASADLARRLAPDLQVRAVPSVGAAEALAAQEGWGRSYPGLMGTRGWTGGFDHVYDAVGSPATLGAMLRLVRAGGRGVLLGASGLVPRLDLTPLWAHEIRLDGTCGYGAEAAAGGAHTLDLVLERMAARPEVPVGDLLTHRYPLAAYRQAVEAAFFHRRSRAVKVAFDLRGGA